MTAHPPGQLFKDARKAAYFNPEGRDKPLKSPLSAATLEAARAYRLQRLRGELDRHDCAALLLYDPVNIRYAFDVSNMQIWTAHNAVRYALISNGGPAIMFECKGCEHLCAGLPAIDEVRPATSWLYMTASDRLEERVERWADEIADIVRRHGGGNRRIAIDKVEPLGLKALEARGLAYVEGQELTERARVIKSAEEIALMRWTIRVCEAGMARMHAASVPGVTEQEIWAELHFENARSGGEWLETRLVTAGPRTNPWYQECSDRPVREGEMIAFDTDMVGPYGYCADLSRSWTCGHVPMNATQARLYRMALDQIEHNMALLRPGLTLAAFNEKSWRLPEACLPYRYSVAIHGVGMVDEWPSVPLHPDFQHGYDGMLEKDMVVCVEALIAERDTESIKLETQVLITDTGCERLDSFPWEEA